MTQSGHGPGHWRPLLAVVLQQPVLALIVAAAWSRRPCKTGSRMVLANEHMAPHESSHPYMITALQVNARQATAGLTANEKNECCA